MSKYVGVLSCLSIFLLIIVGCNQKDELLKENLTGELILSTPVSSLQKDNKGLAIFKPSLKKYEIMLNDQYLSSPTLNRKKDKVLARSTTKIVEYDMKNKTLNVLYIHKDNTIDNISYIPTQDSISFTAYENGRENIYGFNKNSGSNNILIKDIYGSYSWSKDGRLILFGRRSKAENGKYKYSVNMYNINMGKEETLFEGYAPQYSNNNQYIAYKEANASNIDNILVIREITTAKEWIYKSNAIYTYRFSPDDNYIAIEQQSRKFASKDYEIIVWDFKSSKKDVLIETITRGYNTGFDWK
ncbi:TolB family protein [Lutispora sp.]|uniref:TolB family protein n=1 Tax=Lutispora sp. TaxID=2828727 RepID=UPI003564DE70